MIEVKVDDEVLIFDVNKRRAAGPSAGQPGKVTKVGPQLFTVDSGHGNIDVFRRDTGRINDRYGHRYVQTHEQIALEARREAAVATLKKHHVELGLRNTLTVQQIEALANLLHASDPQ